MHAVWKRCEQGNSKVLFRSRSHRNTLRHTAHAFEHFNLSTFTCSVSFSRTEMPILSPSCPSPFSSESCKRDISAVRSEFATEQTASIAISRLGKETSVEPTRRLLVLTFSGGGLHAPAWIRASHQDSSAYSIEVPAPPAHGRQQRQAIVVRRRAFQRERYAEKAP